MLSLLKFQHPSWLPTVLLRRSLYVAVAAGFLHAAAASATHINEDPPVTQYISPDGCDCLGADGKCPDPSDTPETCLNVDFECTVPEECNDGTVEDDPRRTWRPALESLRPGDTLIVKDGTWTNSDSCAPTDPTPCVAGVNLPKARCDDDEWGHYLNGTPKKPITIAADNERQAFLRSDGSDYALAIQGCSHWHIVGLRGRSDDLPGPRTKDGVSVCDADPNLRICDPGCEELACPDPYDSDAPDGPRCGWERSVFDFIDSSHLVVRRNLGSHNNRFFNTHIFDATHNVGSLFEENEAYFHSRHAFSAQSAHNVTFRRNYSHSRRYHDVCCGRDSHDAAPDMGDEAITLYYATDSLAENNIGEFSEGIQATGQRNWILGSAVLDSVTSFRILSNCSDAGGNCDLERTKHALLNYGADLVSVGTQTIEIPNCPFPARNCGVRLPIAFDSDSSEESEYRHTSAFESSHYAFRSQDRIVKSGYDNSFRITRSLSVGSALNGFRKEDRDHSVCTPASECTTIDWSGDLLVAWEWGDKQAGFQQHGEDPDLWGEHYEMDPELQGCLAYLPESSPMWTSDGGRIGAELLYRYENGILTREPLWDPETLQFPCGEIVTGINDQAGESCINVHERLRIGAADCPLPEGYGSKVWLTEAPDARTRFDPSLTAVFRCEALSENVVEAFHCSIDGGTEAPCSCDEVAGWETPVLAPGPHWVEIRAEFDDGQIEEEGRIHRWIVDDAGPSSIEEVRLVSPTTIEVILDEPIAVDREVGNLEDVPVVAEDIELHETSSPNSPVGVCEVTHLRIDRGRRLRIELDQDLPPGQYELTIADLKDIVGNDPETRSTTFVN